jgi:RNA polymerase sigma factor (sigma-70 family)
MAKADNETLIVALLQSDDSSAVQQGTRLLTQLAQPLAFQIVKKNNGSREDGEDLLQDGVVIIWQQLSRGKYSQQAEGSFGGYVRVVLRNLWLRKLRDQQQLPISGGLPLEEISAEEETSIEIDLHRLELALTQLDDTCRQILEGYYFEKLDLKTIAQRLGKTYGAVKEQKYRCVHHLRAIFIESKLPRHQPTPKNPKTK